MFYLNFIKNTLCHGVNDQYSIMSSNKIEFAVQMTCDSCVDKVQKALKDVPGVNNVEINLEKQSVVVDTSLPTLDVQKKLESTGKKVVVRGYDGSIAAVTILETGDQNVKGVVRFVQATPNTCIIDGTIDGLTPGQHEICVYECGDLSNGCANVGDVYNPTNAKNGRIFGDLGTINAQNNGRAVFRFEDDVLKLSEVIGRSFVVRNKNQRVTCGIIARSAGLFQNPKQICPCDGVSIWDESNQPKSVL